MRTPEQDREYQRQRRAKIRSMADQTASPMEAQVAKTLLDEIYEEDPSLMDIPRRDNLRNLHRDGLPDTATLIANMSQARRDAILEAMPKSRARSK